MLIFAIIHLFASFAQAETLRSNVLTEVVMEADGLKLLIRPNGGDAIAKLKHGNECSETDVSDNYWVDAYYGRALVLDRFCSRIVIITSPSHAPLKLPITQAERASGSDIKLGKIVSESRLLALAPAVLENKFMLVTEDGYLVHLDNHGNVYGWERYGINTAAARWVGNSLVIEGNDGQEILVGRINPTPTPAQ